MKAKIALEALREQATVADLAPTLSGTSQPDLCLEEELLDEAAHTFGSGNGNSGAEREREIE